MPTEIHQNEADPTRAALGSETLLHDLRGLVPDRRVSHLESLRITEAQAAMLRSSLGVEQDHFPTHLVQLLPRVEIQTVDDIPASGTSFWGNRTWHIHIHAQETATQHRFTVLHELKHIIDHPNQRILYDEREFVVYGEREIVADYFAACVSLPEDRLRAAYGQTRDHAALAHRFGVSTRRLLLRLSEIGLTETVIHIPQRSTSRTDYLTRATSGFEENVR